MAKRKRISFTAWGIRTSGGGLALEKFASDVVAALKEDGDATTYLSRTRCGATAECQSGETPVKLRIEEIEK